MLSLALSKQIYFLPFETPTVTFCLLAPWKNGNACFGEQVGSKYGTWYSERVFLQFICVGSWAGVTYLRYTVMIWVPTRTKQLFTIATLLYRFLSWLVSQNVFHVTVINASAAVTLLEQTPEKIFRLWAGFEPTTSAMPVQCSPNWAIKATWERSYVG